MFVSRTSSATTTKQRCVIFRSRLYVVTQRCALIHDHRTLVALFFRWRRVARTVWPPSIIRVENKRRRGRSRKVKNIRFENSISTIYQTYPSILPCSLTKEKRSKHLSSYSIFQSQSMQRCVSLPRYPTPSLQTFSHNFFLPEKSVAMRFLSVGAGSLERRCIVTSSLVNGACKT